MLSFDQQHAGQEPLSRNPSLSNEPFMPPPTPEPGQAGFTPGGVSLSPIIEQYDSEKTPTVAQNAFTQQNQLPSLEQNGKPHGPHKRVVSDVGSPQHTFGFVDDVQRPRSQSVAQSTDRSSSFDYSRSRIWNDNPSSGQASVAASPMSSGARLSRSSTGTPSRPPSTSAAFNTAAGFLESPERIHSGLWNALPNHNTPTKQMANEEIDHNSSPTNPIEPQRVAPWRISQRPQDTKQSGKPRWAMPKGLDMEVVRLIPLGLGIEDSGSSSSLEFSGSNSESPVTSDAMPAAQQSLTFQQREEKKRKAKELAAFIKTGAFDGRNQARQVSTGSMVTPPQFFQQLHPVPMQQMMAPPIDALVAYFRSNNGASYEEMVNNMPLEDKCFLHSPMQSGVVHITDIPYATTRQEIVAFFGRNARFVHQPANSPYYAIHIIMERATGKSMDCFVEFQTPEDATIAAARFANQPRGKGPRIGHRSVTVSVVDPSAMMKELFPRAKYVQWQGCQPVVTNPVHEDGFVSSGFQGFVTNEELHMTVKLATDPKRSKYTANHLQRTYESMISLLSKYPWHMTTFYTIGERDRIFQATLSTIGELVNQVQRGLQHDVLTPQLLSELILVAHSCPGFNDSQRALVVDKTCYLTGAPPKPLTVTAPFSPFKRLTKMHNVSDELMKFLAQILCQAASRGIKNVNVNNHKQQSASPFGSFTIYPNGMDVSQLTMWQAVNMEWAALDTALQQCLHRTHI